MDYVWALVLYENGMAMLISFSFYRCTINCSTGLQSRSELDKKITEQARQVKSLQQELLLVQRAYAKKENLLDHVREEIRCVH